MFGMATPAILLSILLVAAVCFIAVVGNVINIMAIGAKVFA